MNLPKSVYLAGAVLVLSILACSKAGEVLTPEQATQQALIAEEVTAVPTVALSETGIQVGDRIRFASKDYLVLMKRDPGSSLIAVQSERGATGTVIDTQSVDGEPWNETEVTGGAGWVPGSIVELVSTGGEATFEPGNTAFLTSENETAKLLVAPGNNLGSSEIAVGTEVTILQSTDFQGEIWYKVRTPDGEGWVQPVNLSAEAP